MKPIIGITTGEILNKIEPWAGVVYGQNYKYSDAIIAAGGVPILIPFMPDEELKALYAALDGIVFAGGNDIDPLLYGEEAKPRTKHVSPDRDHIESLLMTWSLDDDKPLLAICRGFQLLNVLLGGTLYQDIPSEFTGASDHELSSLKENVKHIAHNLKIAPESRLASIIKSTTIQANTHHHQGVKKVADALHAVGWAEDGLVEVLEDPNKTFAIGVQCHPESLQSSEEKWSALFSSFIEATSGPSLV